MIKIVDSVKYSNIIDSFRFDSKYYFMGEVLEKTLSKFTSKELATFTHFIKKGIFDLNSKYYQNSGIPFIRISNLKSYTIDEDGLVYIPIANHIKEIKTKLIPSDLALSKIGKYLGKIAYIPSRFKEVNISQNIIGVSFKCKNELRNYIFLYLTTPLAISQIIRVSKAHNQNKLTLPDIRKLKIPVLSDTSVRKYSKVVTKIKKLEDDSYRLLFIAQKKLYKHLNLPFDKIKSDKTFDTTVKKIIDESYFLPQYSNPKYIKSINLLKKRNPVKLSAICTFKKGNEVGSDNYNLYLDKLDTDIPFIRTTDIVNYEIDNYPDFYINLDLYNELKQDIKPNDILFTNDGKIGQVALITENDKVIIQSHYRRIRLKKEIDQLYKHLTQEYIFLTLSLPEIGLYQSKKYTIIQSTIPTISKNLSNFIIPVLSKEKVDELTAIVKKAFQKKNERKKLLSEIKLQLEKEFETKTS